MTGPECDLVTTEPATDGDAIVDVYTFAPGTSEAAALASLDYPDGYRCLHSHDCCGGWYPRRATVSYVNGKLTVTQRWYQNV